MLYWLGAAAVIILCIFVPFKIEMEYAYSAVKDRRLFILRVLGIKVFSFNGQKKEEKKENKAEEPERKEEEKKPFSEKIKGAEKALQVLEKELPKTFNSITKSHRCDKLVIHLQAGVGDAAATGMIVGVAYGVVYGFASLVANTIGVKGMDIQVSPDFNDICVNFYFDGIFTLSFAHIIRVILMILRVKKLD